MNQTLPRLFLACTLALLSACTSSSEPTGSASFRAWIPQGLEASVARVTVTVTASDFSPLSVNLTQTGGVWSGTLGNIPPGQLRTFRAQAFDASDTPRFQGQKEDVTITSGRLTAVELILQQITAPGPQYDPPVIDTLALNTPRVGVGESLNVSVTAHDVTPGDTLTYAWSATAGTFSTATSTSTSWTAPASPGNQTLTITVTDSTGLSSSASVVIQVTQQRAEPGSAQVSVQFNRSPVVTAMTLSPTRVAVNQSTSVSVTASDPDGDAISYAWTASCAGTWSGRTVSTPAFTPSELPAAACNNCRLTVGVTDGRGLTTTSSISLCVSNTSPAPRNPPLITASSQSATTVSAGETISAEVVASDPGNTALAFAWSAATGTLGSPTSSAPDRSRVTWTAPACTPGGAATGFTVTVTNAANLTASKTFTVTGLPSCGPSWSTAAPMSTARCGHSATQLTDGRVFISGGYPTAAMPTTEVYRPDTGTWASLANMLSPRANHTVTLLPNGKLLVAGGFSSGYLQSAELYDPSTNTWSPTRPMWEPRDNHTATLLSTGKVLVTGGGEDGTASAELYDPSTGRWSITGSMSVARRYHRAVLLPDGRVLVLGGNNLHSRALRTAEFYDPATGAWSPATSMIQERAYFASLRLPNGRVLVMGGYNYDQYRGTVSLSSAEVYYPDVDAWYQVNDLTTLSGSLEASLLPTGKVLVTGRTPRAFTNSAEILDPATGTWSPAGTLPPHDSCFTFTPLSDGRVLLTGGYASDGGNGTDLSSTELYTP